PVINRFPNVGGNTGGGGFKNNTAAAATVWVYTVCTVAAAPTVCTPPAASHLAVTLRPQQTNMWCWAASGQMVMEFLGVTVQQCTGANNGFGRSGCCNTPTPGSCVNGGWPEFDKYGFTFVRPSNLALTWYQLRSESSNSW